MDGLGWAAARLEVDAELPRRVGELMAALISGVLGDLDLSVEQRAVADAVVPRRLQEMRAALESGSGS